MAIARQSNLYWGSTPARVTEAAAQAYARYQKIAERAGPKNFPSQSLIIFGTAPPSRPITAPVALQFSSNHWF
jgi:hypothetical protein